MKPSPPIRNRVCELSPPAVRITPSHVSIPLDVLAVAAELGANVLTVIDGDCRMTARFSLLWKYGKQTGKTVALDRSYILHEQLIKVA